MSGDDLQELDAFIARVQRLGREGVNATAALAAPLVEAEVRRTAAAGTTPTGQAWAPTKKDGSRAMPNAAQHVSAKSAGSTIRVRLEGPDVHHHFPRAGEVRRQVIPDDGQITPGIANAIKRAASHVFGLVAP